MTWKRSIEGYYGTPTHVSWRHMCERIKNKRHHAFSSYGGRCLAIQWDWLWHPELEGSGFLAFLRDMGERPESDPVRGRYTIERIKNEEGYYRDNCEWATARQQANNRRSNVFLLFKGKTQTAIEWSRELNIPVSAIRSRVNKLYWSVDDALTIPIGGNRHG